jgi:hypothetical protein
MGGLQHMQLVIEVNDLLSEGQQGSYRVQCAAFQLVEKFNALIDDEALQATPNTYALTVYKSTADGEEKLATWPLVLTPSGRFDLNPIVAKEFHSFCDNVLVMAMQAVDRI